MPDPKAETGSSLARTLVRAAGIAAATAGVGLAAASIQGARRAARHTPHAYVSAARVPDPVLTQLAADDLTALIQCATISAESQRDPQTFGALHAVIDQRFPLLTQTLEVTRFGRDGLMYKWAGTSKTDAGTPGIVEKQDLNPLVLMAHQDVVPIAEPAAWNHDPFAGENDGERVHGRGAIDDKGALAVTLRGVETLLEQGFTPHRDIYLCFGDEEEVAGDTATQMAEWFKTQGITPFLVLDEGGAVVEPGSLPGVPTWASMIGVAEKGLMDVQLTATAEGGHASTPPKNGATTRIARAAMRIEKNPFPGALPEATRLMLSELGRYAPASMRMIYANVDALSGPLTKALQLAGPETAAMTRTTAAVTQLSGSPASNVLAETATATVNLRLAVGTTSADAMAYLRRVVDDDSIEMEILTVTEPSRVSRVDNRAFELLTGAARFAFPDAVPAPYIQNGATDARRFAPLSDAVYRFSPLRMTRADRNALHAANESVLVSTLGEGVEFMMELISTVDAR